MSARAGRAGSRMAGLLLLSTLVAAPAFGWGLEGHRIVTGAAADRMPAPLGAFFRAWREEVVAQSLVPDTVLKNRDPGERSRHFINIEEFEGGPFDALPRTAGEAEKLLGKRRAQKTGVLPWAIEEAFEDLRKAFEAGQASEIAARAGLLAHYVADAHQPLHLTKNYDGRATCNTGIHSAFETFLVERNAARYRKALDKGAVAVRSLEDPFEETTAWMRETYTLREEIYEADKAALRALKTKGGDYYKSLDRGAGAIAQSRMSAAANALGSLWLTAWIRAGRPDPPAAVPGEASGRPEGPAGEASARRIRGGSGTAPR